MMQGTRGEGHTRHTSAPGEHLFYVARRDLTPVVVADGSDLLRRATVRVLQSSFSVHAVPSGEEALAHLERLPRAVLVTALRMSPMDGRTLIERIIKRWPDRASRVVVMTGWPAPHPWVPVGVRILSKPVAPQTLLAAVRECVARFDATISCPFDGPCGAGSLP